MTEIERDTAIQEAMASGLYLPLKRIRLEQIYAEYDQEQLIEQITEPAEAAILES